MASYEDAEREWHRALHKAGRDVEAAHGLLLARVLHELEANNTKLQALGETLAEIEAEPRRDRRPSGD